MEQYIINKENIDEDGDTIYNQRNYIINEENNSYTFRIDSCGKNLFFSISMKDNLEYNYKIKMNLSTIVDKLELNPQAFNKIELIIKIFDNIYENKKISINLIDDRACTLIVKFINVLEEKAYDINLEKNYLSEKEKYTDIINRFKLLNKYINVYDEKILQMNNKIVELEQKNKEIVDKINKKDIIINEMNQKIKEQENKYDKFRKLFVELIQKNSVTLETSFNSKIENLEKTMNDKSIIINNFINKNNINNQNELALLKSKINLQLESKIDKHELLLNKIKNINDNFINNISDINNKFNQQKYINEKINNIIHYENKEYTKKIKYKFQKDPTNLHYKGDIAFANVPNGWNDIFEVFISYKDCKEYFVSPNVNTFNLDIYDLTLNNNLFNNLFISLKGHNSSITTVRYFLNNKNNEEYLISTDNNSNVIIWDINNNYNIKSNFNTLYGNSNLSCLLIFLENSYDNYIVTSAENKSDINDNLATKVYSFNNGILIKYIKNTNNKKIYYLLSWFNRNNKINYIIQFAEDKIIMSNLLESEQYYELANKEEAPHLNGFIKYEDKTDYLYSSSTNGYIHIWDLYGLTLRDIINVTNQQPLSNIIQWNNNYIIAADYNNCSFKIVSKDQTNLNTRINVINPKHSKPLAYIKKINHPIYGESLLSAAMDNTIKLWNTD